MESVYVVVLGSLVESIHGYKTTALIWLASAFTGPVFAALTAPAVFSYGQIPACWLFSLYAFLAVNWKAMENNRNLRCCIAMLVGFVTFFLLMQYLQAGFPGAALFKDGYGTFFATFAFGRRLNPRANATPRSVERICKLVGIGALGIYFATCYLTFFLGASIPRTPWNSTCAGIKNIF